MLELVLTRVFSAVILYHFAFMAISLALIGMGASGIMVYVFKEYFTTEKLYKQVSTFALLSSIFTIIPTFIVPRMYFPGVMDTSSFSPSHNIFASLLVLSLLFIAPFFLSGLIISLVLYHLSSHVNRIYFFDLLGAGLGCLAVILTMNLLGGLCSLFLIAALGALSAFFLGSLAGSKHKSIAALVIMALCLGLIAIDKLFPFTPLRYARGMTQEYNIYTRWDAFSRVNVTERFANPDVEGLSVVYQGELPDTLGVWIDTFAYTPIIKFSGDYNESAIQFLRYDINSLPYYLKRNADVLIIGPGGGRDVLVALLLGSRHVDAVEINPTIGYLSEYFADYSGRLFYDTRASLYIEEGRSFIQRSKKKYDIIHVPMVDTSAATLAGAFALSENYIYTVEAFVDYLEHLKPTGILSITRHSLKQPRTIPRLAAIAIEALREMGIDNPQAHIAILQNPLPSSRATRAINGKAVFIVKRTPFTEDEIELLKDKAETLRFKIFHLPGQDSEHPSSRLISSVHPKRFIKHYEFDISPTVDDKPFFFYAVKPWYFFTRLLDGHLKENILWGLFNQVANWLFVLFFGLVVVVILFLVAPLWLRRRTQGSGSSLWAPLLYFSCLGLGFMLIEIFFIHSFIFFLGHPLYSLSVVLFSLLIFTGLGSWFAERLQIKAGAFLSYIPFILCLGLLLYLPMKHYLFYWLISMNLGFKVLLSVILIFPAGFFMGMLFPSGIRYLGDVNASLIPWAWAMNGATSILGSTLAIILAVNMGFTAVCLIGIVIYLLAGIFLRLMLK